MVLPEEVALGSFLGNPMGIQGHPQRGTTSYWERPTLNSQALSSVSSLELPAILHVLIIPGCIFFSSFHYPAHFSPTF